MGAKGGDWEGEGLRWAIDTALQPGTHSGAQPRAGREPVVAGAPFSWKEQRDSMGIPAGVSRMNCSWAQRRGKDTAWVCGYACQVVGIPDRETKPKNPATLQPPRAHHPSFSAWGCGAHYLQTSELKLQNLFPEQRVHSVSSPRSGHRVDTAARLPLQGGKNNKEASWFLQPIPPPCIAGAMAVSDYKGSTWISQI